MFVWKLRGKSVQLVCFKREHVLTLKISATFNNFFFFNYQATVVLVGALGPVSHKRSHFGWKQTSIHLLLILHISQQTRKFFKILQTCLNTHTHTKKKKHHKTHFFSRNCQSEITLFKKHVRLGHAGFVNPSIWFITTTVPDGGEKIKRRKEKRNGQTQ